MEIRVSTVESSCRMWKIQGLAYVTVEYGRLTIYSNLNWMNGNPGLHCRIIMSNVENTRISLCDCRIRSIDHLLQPELDEWKSGLHCRILMSNVENTRISLCDCRIRSIDHLLQPELDEWKSGSPL
ncbi:hypothetical protein CDAR_259821 [Caerostris darwini]|uniref:Uncharacterized protein n=1 Tax=Caerostris darwini TaxID=1538125 RepID=A0AAV4VP07_9ARAC|nr:hypothetical protein CDAR_259821 [Caerostris darwini]